MCNTEFIQIEAGLLKVNAGVQHSKCLKYVKCKRSSYKYLVNNRYGKPQEKYGIWSCMHITSACSHQSCMCGKLLHFCMCSDNVIQISI